MKYPIGYKYVNRKGKICTVINYYITYNVAGDVVKERYVIAYGFCGQGMIDDDVVQASIDMGEKYNDE